MRLLPGLVAAIALAAAPAMAQDTAAADPAKLAVARQIIDASGGRKTIEAMLTQVYSSMDQMFAKSFSADQQRVMSAIQRDMKGEMLRLVPTLIDLSAEVYAKQLTEKELHDMLAWQTSESGRSIAAKLPVLTQEALKAEMPYLQAMLPRVMEKAISHACEEAKCTPAERQQAARAIAQMQSGRPS